MRQLGFLGLVVLAASGRLWCPGSASGAPSSDTPPAAAVRPGIDVLLADSSGLIRGRRVGLVSHAAAVDARGVPSVDRLLAAGVRLVALFSPEHGWRGRADPGAVVPSTTDSATGLPIYSLYGRNSEPTDSMLAGIDVLLVDLQDAGARYYTYLWTVVNVMRAAARHGLPVMLLDRPNPIGGAVEGNLLDTAYRSPVGLLAVPMRHGLTLGELARLARSDLGLGTDLHVIPALGWNRSQYLDQTGLPFQPPSPNLPRLEALIHYPGLCLFEGTNLSVGRGTDHPFEQIGAPWLDTATVLAGFRSAAVPGVTASSVAFTPARPGDGKYADTALAGIRLRVTDRNAYDPTRATVTLLQVVRRAHPHQFSWLPAHFDRLAGGPALRQAIDAGVGPDSLVSSWARDRAGFAARAAAIRLYP